ncbi:MAG: NAD(P)/FAD-dependent oxidoreductase [Deltaproteobacteria bacterium]|jgi:phytoene dehydrogenase-like protein|nr:NAD(P)/FAD-dependent oxidoreductase [Deltaproteobacteria bacterium]
MVKRARDPGKILVVGSGVGGLTAGILLTKLGYSVTIVEKNAVPGGLLRGYRRSGIDCPVGIHYLGSLAPGEPLRRLWDCLGVTEHVPLERMGLDGPIDRYVFDDFVFDLPEGLTAFEDSLRQSFPAEQRQIAAFIEEMRPVFESFARLDMLTTRGIQGSLDNFSPMGEYVARLNCSLRLVSVLAVPTTLIGIPFHDCPRFYYYMILASYLLSSWRLVESTTVMTDRFIQQFQSLGGELLVGDAVDCVTVNAGAIKGLRLKSGRCLPADTVIAAIHPRNVLSMLPPKSLRPEHEARITGLENTKGLLVVTLAVDDRYHAERPYNLYRLYPEADGSLSRGSFHQIRRSNQPETLLLTIMTTSGIDEWAPWLDTRTGQRGEEYEEAKWKRAGTLLADATDLFGSLQGMRVIDIYTPLTIRDWVGSPGGSAYGIMRSSAQLLKTACLSRPSLAGLYFAGQNILAPGILGTTLGSFQVVRRIIGRKRFAREIMEECC